MAKKGEPRMNCGQCNGEIKWDPNTRTWYHVNPLRATHKAEPK